MCPRFAVIGEGPLGILNDQDSLLATTAGWPPLAVRRIGRLPFMAVQNPERKGRSATRLFFFERFILSSPGGIANRHGEPPIECRPRHAFAAGDSRKPVTEHRLGGQPVGKARSFPMTEEDRGSASGSRGC